MLVNVVKSKIHRVKVTQADLNYIGSITIDEVLMKAANIIEGERVQIVNINNGERIETYAIKGEPKSGTICLIPRCVILRTWEKTAQAVSLELTGPGHRKTRAGAS